MEISMRQYSCFEFAGLTRDRGCQSGRDDSVQHAVALLDPCAVQNSKPRGPERAFRPLELLALSFVGSGPSRLEEAPQLLQLRRAKRGADLLPKRLSIPVRRVGQVVRYQDPDAPGRQRPQQLGVALEEHAEVAWQRPCRQIQEQIRPAVVA